MNCRPIEQNFLQLRNCHSCIWLGRSGWMGMQLDPGGNLESFLSKQVTLRLSLGVWEMGNVVGSGIVLLGLAIPSRRRKFQGWSHWMWSHPAGTWFGAENCSGDPSSVGQKIGIFLYFFDHEVDVFLWTTYHCMYLDIWMTILKWVDSGQSVVHTTGRRVQAAGKGCHGLIGWAIGCWKKGLLARNGKKADMPSKTRAFAEAILETSRKQMGQAIQSSKFWFLGLSWKSSGWIDQDETRRKSTRLDLMAVPFDRCEVYLKPGYEPDLPD